MEIKNCVTQLRRNYKSLLILLVFVYSLVIFFLRGRLANSNHLHLNSLDHRLGPSVSLPESESLKKIKEKMVLPTAAGLNLSGPVHTGQVNMMLY